MGQIQEIIDMVASANPDIETALVRCKILAKRIGYSPLAEWVDSEINGYSNSNSLPDYRKHRAHPVGIFTNGVYQINNKPLDRSVVGDDMFDQLSALHLRQGIRELSVMKNSPGLQLSLSHAEPYVNSLYALEMEGDYGFIGLHLSITPNVIEGVLGAVRSKLVDFLLEMEDIFPEDEDIKHPSAEQKREVAQAFTQIVIHQADNITIGDHNHIEDSSQRTQVNIQAGNTEEFIAYLESIGLDNEDVEEINPLLGYVYDGNLSSSQKLQLRQWVESRGAKLAGSLGKEAAVSLIVQALLQFAPAAVGLL